MALRDVVLSLVLPLPSAKVRVAEHCGDGAHTGDAGSKARCGGFGEPAAGGAGSAGSLLRAGPDPAVLAARGVLIDTGIKSEDKEEMQEMLRWEAEKKEMMEKRCREEAAEKEHKEEEERRRVAAYREEREKKLEHARRAKVAMEENPDALRKGKWPRCNQ
uniref:Uncharacterized protein n=1 Tax=Setaria viridis TaxID=4556 RepID=A0A4U6SSN2_SETVI|nr:LOW QUALITY PROTEIN: hypothetical protein SEVIR_9G105400v2 [Setaria viridis]